MLIKKGALNKRTKIMLIVLIGIVVVGGGYLYYSFYGSQTPPDELQNDQVDTSIDIKSYQVQFDEEIFIDPQLLSLEREEFEGFSDQYAGISFSTTKPIAISEIDIANNKVGNSLIIKWQLPEFINFNNVAIYRSSTPGVKGESIYETKISKDAASSLMSYQDTGVTNDKVYYYLVVSYIIDEDGNVFESVKSSNIATLQLSGTPTDEVPPASPSDVQVIEHEDGTLEVRWINPDDGDFNNVNIYRSSESGQIGSLIISSKYNDIGNKVDGSDYRNYLDKDVESNIVYYYTVTSVDTSENESTKNVLSAPFKPFFYNPFKPIEFE